MCELANFGGGRQKTGRELQRIRAKKGLERAEHQINDTTRLRQEESQSQTEIVTHILQLPSNSTRLVYFSLGLMNMMGKRKEQCSNAVQRIKIQSLLSNNLHT